MQSEQNIIRHAFGLVKERQFGEALAVFDKLLGHIDEDDFNVLMGMGTCLAGMERHGEAVHFLRHAIALKDDYSPLWNNLANCLRRLRRDWASKEAFERAITLDPRNGEACAGLCGWYHNRGSSQESTAWGAKAVELLPHNADARVNYAIALLECGRFAEAWPYYESRWDLEDNISKRRPYLAPKWEGQYVKTLAIHGEQGLGDEILFMGCFWAAQSRVNRVIIECAARLTTIFQRSFNAPCYGTHEELIAAEGEPDAYVPMGSLPGLVGLPTGKSYLMKPSAAAKTRPRIGLAWKGGTDKTNKRERALKLTELEPLYSLSGLDFVSVQYGEQQIEEECAAAGLTQVYHGRDMNECLEALASCELIITCCQTAAHLAGAAGIPCWVLTPKACAWRYSGPTDRMLPWYKDVRLFRQGDDEQWAPVIARVRDELKRAFQ